MRHLDHDYRRVFPPVPGLDIVQVLNPDILEREELAILKCRTCGRREKVNITGLRMADQVTAVQSRGWLAESSEYGVECGICRADTYRFFQMVTL